MRLGEAEFAKCRALAMGGTRLLKHQGVIDGKAAVQDDARYVHRRHELDQLLRGQSRDDFGAHHANQARVKAYDIDIMDQRPKGRDGNVPVSRIYCRSTTDKIVGLGKKL